MSDFDCQKPNLGSLFESLSAAQHHVICSLMTALKTSMIHIGIHKDALNSLLIGFFLKIDEDERINFAEVFLNSINRDDADNIVHTYSHYSNHPQVITYTINDARENVEDSSQRELKLNVLANFERLSKENKAAFLDYVQGPKLKQVA